MLLLRKYAAALLPALFTVLGVLQVAIKDNQITDTEAGQLITALATVGIVWVLPLFKGAWAGLFKTGFAALGAVATLVVPLFTGFTWEAAIIFTLAILNVVITEIGVNMRTDELVPVTPNHAGVFDVTSVKAEDQPALFDDTYQGRHEA